MEKYIMGMIMGYFISIFTNAGKDTWTSIKNLYNKIKENYQLFKNVKQILNDYKNLKENNEKYKNQAQQYNIFYESSCREYYINQIKEKYGEELCTPEILQKYWLDDYNQWKTEAKINGNIYKITSIGLDTYNKNIWKSFGSLTIYD